MSIQRTTQGGIKTSYQHFTVSAVYLGNKTAPWTSNHYYNSRVTVYNRHTGKRTNFEFWGSLMQPELCTRYDLLNALYCFVSDAVSGNQDFADFCTEFGYKQDSIKAYRTWKACRQALLKLRRILDTDLYHFCNALAEQAA